MKKYSIFKNIMIIIMAGIIALLPSQYTSAQDLSYNLSSTILPVVSDKAGILSDYEEVTILNKFTELRDESSYQFIFMTAANTDEYTKGNEVEAMYNMHRDDLFGTGTILFLISTDTDNLICEIQAYNGAKDIFSYEVCTYISGKLRNYVEDGNYYDGIMKFFDYYEQAYGGTLAMSDENKQADGNSVFSYMTNHVTLTILIAAVSLLITALIYLILSAKKNRSENHPKSGKISQDTAVFAGKISYKYKQTADRVTYIRTRASK